MTTRPVWLRVLDVIEAAIIAILFTALVLGVTVGLVATPGVTAWMIRTNSTWRYTGMTPSATVQLADETRAWVVGEHGGTAFAAPAAVADAYIT